jgi:site-specific DNA recombinase
MKTVLGYIRISKDEEGSGALSLDYQNAEISKYCERNGYKLVSVECDQGISGKSIKVRPAVQRVIKSVEDREVDAVVVFKSDRVSRDGIESLQIEKLFLRRGVEYLSVTEGNLTGDSCDDEFMRFIRAGLNQRERKLISLRTRQALQKKREKGERIGGRPAYGWMIVEGQLLRNQQEQHVIRRMKALRRKGTAFTQTQVVRILRAA